MKLSSAVGCLVMLFGAVAAVSPLHTPTRSPASEKHE